MTSTALHEEFQTFHKRGPATETEPSAMVTKREVKLAFYINNDTYNYQSCMANNCLILITKNSNKREAKFNINCTMSS